MIGELAHNESEGLLDEYNPRVKDIIETSKKRATRDSSRRSRQGPSESYDNIMKREITKLVWQTSGGILYIMVHKMEKDKRLEAETRTSIENEAESPSAA